MLPTVKTSIKAGLCKLGPTAKLPSNGILESLTVVDRKTLRRRVNEAVECVFDPIFVETSGNGLVPTPPERLQPSRPPRNDDSGLDLLAKPAAGPSLEIQRFRWLNYCRYRVMRVIEENAGRRLGAAAVAELLRWEHAAAEAREEIVRENLPLVLAMAKRTRITSVDFSDLVSEGNLALMRAADKFDFARGYKFSTYACRAILKSFSRLATRMSRHRSHFPTEFDPDLEKSDYIEKKRLDAEDHCMEELRDILERDDGGLTEVERRVIRARFAIEESADDQETLQGKTLEQVGEMIGVTKERVRQIQNKALLKMRQLLEQGHLAV